MNTKVYVGNLPYEVTEAELKEYFETKGPVSDVHLVIDKYTDRPRGFGFVTMENHDDMLKAIEELDGQEFSGRELKINEARPRENRSPGGGGGGGGYNGGGGGGGGYNQKKSGGGSRKGQRNDRW